MPLSDEKIKALVKSGVLKNATDDRIGPVSYDLRTDCFYIDESKCLSVRLAPGDSAYVAAKESVSLPNDLTARVILRNSRMRQGLTLDAPLYFPGHATVLYFRVTNISGDIIALSTSSDIAQVIFEWVDGTVEHPYEGAFAGEFDYRGMGTYSDVYRADMERPANLTSR